MNIQDILNQAKSQKTQSNKLFAQQEILRGVQGKLERHEMKPDAWFNFVVPKQLQLPFHPVDVQDDFFNSENPYIVKGLIDESVIELKKAMRNDPELHKIYAQLGGLTTEEYDISEEEYTKTDFKIFNEHCYPYQPSLPTIKITTKDAGQFGTVRLSPLEFDENGECITPDLLIWQLRMLEEAVVEQNVAEYLLDKNKSALSDDQKQVLKAKRSGAKIGFPKRTAYLMYLEFPMDQETETVTPEALSQKLEDSLKYMKFNGDELKKVLKKRGKRRDIYNNFWDLQVAYGDGKPSGDETPEISLYKSREYELIQKEDGDTAISIFAKRKDFIEEVNAYLGDNLEHNFEALAKKYIWDFKPISDAALLELYSTRAEEIAKYITTKLYNRFIGIIEKANLEVAKQLHQANKEGKLAIDFTSELTQAVEINGNEITVKQLSDEVVEEEVIEEEVEEDEGTSLEDLLKDEE